MSIITQNREQISFYGERVRLLSDITYPTREGGALRPRMIAPAGTEGIFVGRRRQILLGSLALIRIEALAWSGWVLAADSELERIDG